MWIFLCLKNNTVNVIYADKKQHDPEQMAHLNAMCDGNHEQHYVTLPTEDMS